MNVTIIGGGVIGLCCAYYLRKAGHSVTVIERNNITDGCSFGNMGYISPSHFIPLASPGIVRQAVKWMLNASSPFYIKPRLNGDMVRWGFHFWKSASSKKVIEHAPHLVKLLLLSRELMNGLKKELPDTFDMTAHGCWMLYKDEKTGDHEKRLAEQADVFGLKTAICDRRRLQDYETGIEVNAAGGVLYLDDCHVHPAKFMQSLFRYLQNAGVRFWLNTEAKAFDIANGRVRAVVTDTVTLDCDELIVANGSWMQDIAKRLGIYVPVQPGKGYSIVYNGVEKNLKYPSILVDKRVAVTPIGSWLRIGGTMELSGHDDKVLHKRVRALHAAFKDYYPSVPIAAPVVEDAWFGYRPVSPDGMPYIGRHGKLANVSFAGGHAMLGVSAAAATGLLTAQNITNKILSMPLGAFRPGRFG